MSTVAEPSVDGSQPSVEEATNNAPRPSALRNASERPRGILSSKADMPVPQQVNSRSFSAVSALDELDGDGLTDDERFDREYGSLFEPYDDEMDDRKAAVSTPLTGSSERESLLERGESQRVNNYQTLPDPELNT